AIVPAVTAFGVRCALFICASVGTRLMGLHGTANALTIWRRGDSAWYLAIASGGYTFSTSGQSRANFFPLYPSLVSTLTRVCHLSDLPNGYLLTGLCLSWTAYVASSIVLYRLICDRLGRQVAYDAVLIQAIYPFGFYFGAPMSESLFLLL